MTKQIQETQKETTRICNILNLCLADGLDLQCQAKVAHWNVKGPHFLPLHELFDRFASALAAHNNAIAERTVVLGGEAQGTVRHVTRITRLPDYPTGTRRGLHHIELLAERIKIYLDGLREARAEVQHLGDETTSGLLTTVIGDFEKHAWFIKASLEHYTA